MSRPIAVHRLIQASRAATVVRPGARAFIGELSTNRIGHYRMRDSGDAVTVRHRTRDVEILNEIFSHRAYAPPSVIGERLDGSGIRVLDLGGNIGLFGLWARTVWSVARIDSYEPDPENYQLLENVALSNDGQGWHAHGTAVSNRAGSMRFVSGAFSESRSADAGEAAIDVPMVDLFTLDHDVELLKLDIEGGEWPILTDPRLPELQARALVMEWHARDAPSRDARGTAVERLQAAAYRIVKDDPGPTNGTIWAMR